ncbi:hypothetical protein QVD17_16344 [Tagetes erecta]|uniref:Cathepsin propeptide inhibitor domain-containing protein n=1 Tax=Tagetes erecta TaxID=13708 RepID=A0AAD8P0E8_TARER|nr:hypothetical protein QVD17_16344 [Tagetes erecta]
MASALNKSSSSAAARVCSSPLMHPSRVFRGCGWSMRSDEEVKALFESWMVQFEKVYTSIEEKEKRFAMFRDTLRSIDLHNSTGNSLWRCGLNRFADYTNDEVRGPKPIKRCSNTQQAEVEDDAAAGIN